MAKMLKIFFLPITFMIARNVSSVTKFVHSVTRRKVTEWIWKVTELTNMQQILFKIKSLHVNEFGVGVLDRV